MGHEESERQRMRTEEGLLTKLAVETEKNDMRMLYIHICICIDRYTTYTHTYVYIHTYICMYYIFGNVKLCRDARDT